MNLRITLFIILSFYSSLKSTLAQDSIVGKTSSAVISAIKMNVFYVGLNNPIEICIKEIDKFIAKIDKGKIFVENEKYYVQCPQKGLYRITLFDTLHNELGVYHFLAKSLPQASISIYNKRHEGELPKVLLLQDYCRLIPVDEDFDYQLFYKVTSFRVDVRRLDGSIQSFSNSGNGISQEMNRCFQTLEPGETVYFYEAKGILNMDSDFVNELQFRPLLITIIDL